MTEKEQFIKDMDTTDVKKLTVSAGIKDSFKRLAALCSNQQELDNCKKALLRYIRDYKDPRFE